MKNSTRVLLWTLFIIYCAVMFWLLFGQRLGRSNPWSYAEQLQTNINLMPFRTINQFLTALGPGAITSSYFLRFAFVNITGNVVMFLPMGFFLPCLWPKFLRFWRFVLCIVLTIISVEIIQLFTLLGSCDVDDLILNTLGAAIGYVLYRLAIAPYNKKKARHMPGEHE